METEKTSTSSVTSYREDCLQSNKIKDKRSVANVCGVQYAELPCNISCNRRKTQVIPFKKNKSETNLTNSSYFNMQQRKLKLPCNQNYLLSVAIIIVTYLSTSFGVFALSSDSDMPLSISPWSPHNSPSRKLTKELLNLDLGYSVLNSEMLRQGIGFTLDNLETKHNQEQHIAESRMDSFNRHDHGSEWSEEFYSHEDNDDFHLGAEEPLPTPQPLVHDHDFLTRGGPNPSATWGHGSTEGTEKFWSVSGQRSPFWFPFRPIPPPRRQKPRPNKKLLDKIRRPPLEFGPVINDPRCGLSASRRNVAQRRIVGGSEAGFGTFPWQAYIRIGTSRCGGSLVNEWYVITAGHCVARARTRQIRITLGEYVLKSNAEPLPGRTYGASAIKVHPYFKFTPQADRYDVAVIRLNRRVDMAPHISPVCLPPKNMDMEGHHGLATGWGALKPGSRLRPKTLQVVDVPLIYNRECERWHRDKGINVVIYDEMVCAGYYGGGKDSCQGDSGGPLMTEMEGRWTLIGIVSAGYSCAKRGQPGIYHRVAHTSDWISASINS